MNKSKQDEKPKCGIVMPISECDGCNEGHWLEVKDLIERAARNAGYDAMLVSEADDVGVIQKRIVQNLYELPIVVCDISGRNANVMFELGMRLAFDKPTVIIKDDRTPFSFDTSPIEHVTYPRDLRFSKIETFQENLSSKIKKSASSDGTTSFLKSFGSFKVAEISVERTSIDELILEEISLLKTEIRMNRNLLRHDALVGEPAAPLGLHHDELHKELSDSNLPHNVRRFVIGKADNFGEDDIAHFKNSLMKHRGVIGVRSLTLNGLLTLEVHFRANLTSKEIEVYVSRINRDLGIFRSLP